jgi:NTE family protein
MKAFDFIKLYLILFTILLIIPQISEANERPKIGLVLSGGGAKGMAHIGVLKIIKELGIPVDYVTGTSMGSVVGSLYAAGYTVEEIDSISANIDWGELFNDKLSRDKISIEEKRDSERYILEMPIEKYHFELPQGLIAGQKLSQMLSTLLLPVHEINDFSKLPIPFKCIATDIETGEAVVLDHGDLAISVRASMAIPSIFNPIEIEDKLLVDGGIVRNFPVIDAKEMGADIIIGVNVGGPLYKKEELKSLITIMQQTVAFRGNTVDIQQEKLCDILITPDIHGIGASSFNMVDSIIIRGEKAAMQVYPALKALADSLKRYSDSRIEVRKPQVKKEFLITDIEITGNHIVPDKMILQKLYIKKNNIVTPQQINENVQKIYSTKFFKNVYFQIIPNQSGPGNTLKLRVVEQTANRVKLAIHYDNDLKSALLLNYTTRNLFLNGSKLSIDGRFSENPAILASYFYYTGYNPDVGLGLITGYSNANMAEYEFGNQRVGTSEVTTFIADVRLNTILIPSLCLSAGIRYEASKISVEGMIKGSELGLPYDLPIRIGLSEETNLFNIYGIFNYDNINSRYFTKKGTKSLFTLSHIPRINNCDLNMIFYINPDESEAPETDYKIDYKGFFRLLAKIQQSYLIFREFSITGQVRGGFTNKSLIPIYYTFMLGGIGKETKNIIPFMGARLLEHVNNNFVSTLLSFQYEPMHDKFIILTGNVGYLADNFEDFQKISITDKNFIAGYGLTFGMNSLIGPLSLTFMTKDNFNNMLTYINIGYTF